MNRKPGLASSWIGLGLIAAEIIGLLAFLVLAFKALRWILALIAIAVSGCVFERARSGDCRGRLVTQEGFIRHNTIVTQDTAQAYCLGSYQQ